MTPKRTYEKLEHQYEVIQQKVKLLEQERDKSLDAERALCQSEESYRTLVENLNVGIYRNTGGSHGRFLQANPSIVKMFGYDSVEEFMKVKVSDLYQNPDERKLFIEELLKEGSVMDKELRLKRKDGIPIWGECSAKIQYDQGGAIKWIDGIIEDISERKRAEEKAQKSYYFERTINAVLEIALEPISLEEQLDRILSLVLEIPFLSLQSKGCVYLAAEDTAELEIKAQSGLDDEIERDSPLISGGRCLCGQAAASKDVVYAGSASEPQEECFECVSPQGQYCIPVKSRDRVHGIINLIIKEGHKRDKQEEEFLVSIANTLAGIIEHKKTEEEKETLQQQLMQSEKLSALGRMTANVAHEIRNPLTALGGLAKRLGKKIPEGTKEKEYTKVIVSEADRLERILNSVLSFTKERSLHKEHHNINEIIDEAIHVYTALYEELPIHIEKEFEDVPQIFIDKEQVREVIDNLLANAGEAMQVGGKIRIVSGRKEIEGNQYVTVKVSDTGQGINEEELGRIFEPFFTSKAVGKGRGIGLGLAISKKIIAEHGGHINVESKVGKGSTFSLFFPLAI